jgi:hypothetical protein
VVSGRSARSSASAGPRQPHRLGRGREGSGTAFRDAVGAGEAALAGEIATFLARTGPLAPPSGGGPRSGPVGAGGRGPNPPP